MINVLQGHTGKVAAVERVKPKFLHLMRINKTHLTLNHKTMMQNAESIKFQQKSTISHNLCMTSRLAKVIRVTQ
jgi:3-dehydroquinate synthase class II